MKVTVLGGGPAGLYAALLIKKADPSCSVTVLERNPAGVTYGWGVVFSDRTLQAFQRADNKTYTQITDSFVIWDSIDVRYRGQHIRCGGHVIASISRKALLGILQTRCMELGVNLEFDREIADLDALPDCDLLIGADGVHSLLRARYESKLKPSIEWGDARYIWLGAERLLDSFTFIFHSTPYGLFQVHAYPFSGTTSTFIVECSEQTWRAAGLDTADEARSVAFCTELLAGDLNGAPLLTNNSKWVQFPTLKTKRWSTVTEGGTPLVLLGDAVHTAHFSIGSGTKLAMEDAVGLADALARYSDIGRALNDYELERKPVVETFQRAAQDSRTYFENTSRYQGLEPPQFAFQLLTRSGRISYDDLHFRDARFGDKIDRWFFAHSSGAEVRSAAPAYAPPPLFAPFALRDLALPNRLVSRYSPECGKTSGAGLALAGICAVSPNGRVTEADLSLVDSEGDRWVDAVSAVHTHGGRIAVQIGHAGRRGAVRPPVEGLDRPLADGWPLLAPSAQPYSPRSRVPLEMTRADMTRVAEEFAKSADAASRAGFDLLVIHAAQGYLLHGFLSPLTNLRSDEYGGSLEQRMRFPLEVFSRVRDRWPATKPLAVAVPASDCLKGGWSVEDAILFVRALKDLGCDLVMVHAGQISPAAAPAYGRGFLTPYSDRLRNEGGLPTLLGGYMTTANEANTALAAGRADLCLLEPPEGGTL